MSCGAPCPCMSRRPQLGLSLEQYIEEHLATDSRVIASSGEIIADLAEGSQLEEALQALLSATPHPLVRIYPPCRRRWRGSAGTVYAGAPPRRKAWFAVGLLMGWFLYTLARALLSPAFKEKKSNPS